MAGMWTTGAWVMSMALSFAPPAGGPPERAPANRRPILAFSPDAATSAPEPVQRVQTMEERARALDLVPLADGGYVYVGRGSSRFLATVREDGTVELDVDDGIQVRVDEVCITVICVQPRKNPLRGKNAKDRARLLAQLTREYDMPQAQNAIAGTSGVNPWNPPSGDPAHDHSRLTPPALPAGYVAGRYGWLPYPAHAVASFLDRTFEFRLDLARAAWRERLARQSARLPEDLLEVWRGGGTLARRRAAVLEMWAELEPPHVDPVIDAAIRDDVDQSRIAAADRARHVIHEFVRQHLPAGSRQAFTAAELRRFNATRPQVEQFWPYGRE